VGDAAFVGELSTSRPRDRNPPERAALEPEDLPKRRRGALVHGDDDRQPWPRIDRREAVDEGLLDVKVRIFRVLANDALLDRMVGEPDDQPGRGSATDLDSDALPSGSPVDVAAEGIVQTVRRWAGCVVSFVAAQ
jgi:hypothetical protein